MFCWFYVWQGNISQPWSLSTTWNSRILYTLKNSINWKMFLIRILNIIYACTNKLCICEQAIYDWKQNWNIWHGSLYLHAFVYKMVSYISIYYIFTLSYTLSLSHIHKLKFFFKFLLFIYKQIVCELTYILFKNSVSEHILLDFFCQCSK